MRAIYPQLRALAGSLLRRETTSLQLTELVNEAYLRIDELKEIDWQDRKHFLAICARVIRRVLVDRARHRGRMKRGGERRRIPLSDATLTVSPGVDIELLAIHEGLVRLEATEPDAARLVELRYFGGLSIDEAAIVLGLGRTSAVKLWTFARAWLRWAVAGPGCLEPGSDEPSARSGNSAVAGGMER